MMYQTSRKRQYPTFVVTNKQDKYWLQDHLQKYNELSDERRRRILSDKEAHQYDICLRALTEHGLIRA